MPSENNWEPARANADQCEWVTVPGTQVTLQLLKGWPSVCLRAWAADWNAYIEPLRDADSAGWTPTNAVATSNHLNGTAIDLNWDDHPFRQRGSLNPVQMQTLSEMENFYEGTVFWAGRWDDPIDEMHSQMGYETYNNSHTQDFINRKIRPDGFSTFRREGVATSTSRPVSSQDQIALLVIGESKRRNHTRDETIAELSTGLQESNLNQEATDSTGHRGVYQQDGGYPERESAEGNVRGFFDRLDAKRSSPGASQDIWLNIFWLQQRPSEPNADIAYANGRKGYLTEIRSRIPAATALYDRLAGTGPVITGPVVTEEEAEEVLMAADTAREIHEIHEALFKPRVSKSRYGDARPWTLIEFIENMDGSIFDLIAEHDAALGDPWKRSLVDRAVIKGDIVAINFLNQLLAKPNPVVPVPDSEPTKPNPVVSVPDSAKPVNPSSLAGTIDRLQELKALLNRMIG